MICAPPPIDSQVDPISRDRKGTEGDQFGLQAVIAAGPVALVAGGEAEVGAHREAELEIGRRAVDEVAAHPGNETERIAAVAPDTVVSLPLSKWLMP